MASHQNVVARLYVKTPFYMKHVDTIQVPNVEFIDIPIVKFPKAEIATFEKCGYDRVNNEYLYVNEQKLSHTQS